jgi:hypothetical protein
VQPPILAARGLAKRYGKIRALAGLDLVVAGLGGGDLRPVRQPCRLALCAALS